MSKMACELSETIVMPAEGEKMVTPFASTRQSITKIFSIISLIVMDMIGLLIALSLAFEIRINVLPQIFSIFPEVAPPDMADKLWGVLAFGILCYAYAGLYTKHQPFWRETKKLLGANTLAFMLILAAVALGKMGGEVSRTVLVLTYILTLIILPLCRYIQKSLLHSIGLWSEPLLILGTGESARIVAQALSRDRYLGYQVYGFLQTNNSEASNNIKINEKEYPICGRFGDAATVLATTKIRHVVIAAPEVPGPELVSLTNQLQPYTRSVLVVPDLFGIPVISGEADYFFDEEILAFRTHNNLASRVNIVSKRLFDLIVGLILLIPILPIMAIIALLIRFDSKGPAIFSGNRIGKGGKEFKCYKFRTMYLNNDQILEEYLQANPNVYEEWERFAKLKNYDPRVTRTGKCLRKLSLDELPQIINVLKGEMSLVGARPYLPREKEQMGDYADTILLAPPGITGLWQVSGRNEIDFKGRLRLETQYVRNWSMWLDISLLFRTVGVVLGRKGAY